MKVGEKYPADATLSGVYGNMLLFPELLNAHRANDATVMRLTASTKKLSESEIVTRLFQLYQELTK